MKNRQLDVTLQSAGLGVSALRDLATSVDIIVVAIPADVIKKTNDPAYLPAMIPANTYRGQTADVPSSRCRTISSRYDGVSTDTVYGMTKTLWTSRSTSWSPHIRPPSRSNSSKRSTACRCRFIPVPRSTTRKSACSNNSVADQHRDPQMSTPETSAPTLSEADVAFDETGVKRELTGLGWKVVAGVALAFSTYQLLIAAFSPLSSLVTRSLHVGFLLLLAFLIHPVSAKADRHRIAWYDALIAVLAFALAFYHWIFESDLIQRSGDPTIADLAVGSLVILLVFEAARRVLGLALPIICAAFLAYGLFGQFLPSAIAHRGYGFDQIVGALYLGTEGIYGIPTLVSSTYIFLFILFGSFLQHAGMISLFNDIALGFVGHARGGPAKVAVISSGLMGTISGSASPTC